MKGRFYGWYMKTQSDSQTLAVIPAEHRCGNKCNSSIQIITEENAWNVDFPIEEYIKRGNKICIGENQFGEKGIRLKIDEPQLKVNGKLKFGVLTPLKYDIMGPFAMVPFMECRHSVWSMKHTVNGSICINDKIYNFRNACGYWEGDEGRSFPKHYAWTHCFFKGGSLMLSVAEIPFVGFGFTGVICSVLWHGKQYRLATYLGAKPVCIQNGRIVIVQGNMKFEARLLEKSGYDLKAPVAGKMDRMIRENAACRVRYRFSVSGKTIFAFETDKASFEYEY